MQNIIEQNIIDYVLRHEVANVYWKDMGGHYLGCNFTFTKLAGFNSPDEIIGKSDRDLFLTYLGEGGVQKLIDVDQEVMTQDKERTVEEVGLDGLNQLTYYISKKIPLKDKQGKITGVFGVSFNISDRKEAERLRLQNTVAEQRAKTAAMLAAGIAHELRTPLASVNLLAAEMDDVMEILVKTYQKATAQGLTEAVLNSRQLENALTIGQELRRTAHSANIFINMMLMKVNLEKPKSQKLERLSAIHAIEEALSLYPFRGGDVILLEWNAADNQDFDFMGDVTLFNHILFNLFKNALHYVKAAQKGKIHLWLERGEKCNTLHFKDTGPGIPADVLPHIFDVFYSKTAHGTGVGLALCKMIMSEFGGSIFCDSVVGEYTHFSLEFPMSPLQS